MGASDLVLIDVFEMLINRIDTMGDIIDKMNSYLVSEARFKTDTVISGKIFNYPFEIQKSNYFNKRNSFISLKLNDKLNHKTLYDIVWALLMEEKLTEYRDIKNMKLLEDNIIDKLGKDVLSKIQEGVRVYLNEDREEFLTCKKYNIDTVYEYLPEYLINNFILSREETTYIKSFNHVSYNINICIETIESVYIDDLLELILKDLSQYGYDKSDIHQVKIVGMNSVMSDFIKEYSMNELNLEDIKIKIEESIKKMCPCIKEQLKLDIMEYLNGSCHIIPILNNMSILGFTLYLLDGSIERHS